MIIYMNSPNIPLHSSLVLHRSVAMFPMKSIQVREYRVWRRRRLTNRTLTICSFLGPSPFEDLFTSLISQFPSLTSLDLVAPALGFASGAALYLSRFQSNSNSAGNLDIGEWVLFTSPTPFNRFVMLRCPSVSFEGSELLEDVNEKLVKEDRHFVRLDSGRIHVRDGDDELLEVKLVYQRVCVSADDGGVVSLDWPADLDLTEERGLDTTILLIPGTAEGSMDKDIRSFVCESVKRGFFPVVMNPRGCAGSPLTTSRLFTAADSDDISTVIQFITKARPWTTLMAVGWGFGANMLTKYLAEAGERTPLTAATCIDNPFDLEEATRSYPSHIAVDQKLTGGLKHILSSNKELFQGRAKGFDVGKALTANSVRDFDKAISMVSYGFDAIEDFYAKSSTRGVVGNVKIPLIFMQNDDGTGPLFSIPRSLIAENPFTSLLLCSLPSRGIRIGRSTKSWCQNLTLEWLAAVELALLKGRHPLLKDVDVTINPSKGLTLVEEGASNRSGKFNKPMSRQHLGDPVKEMLGGNGAAGSIALRSGLDLQRSSEIEDRGRQQDNINLLQQTRSVDEELVDDEISPVDGERGQVLQTAHVVMNMLDMTMPGTLAEEQKNKVLTAVNQGESLMKALQDAVPEDVRGKLTSVVSDILHNQGSKLNLNGILSISQIPGVASELKSKMQEKVGVSSASSNEDHHSSDESKRFNDVGDGSDKSQSGADKASEGLEHQAPEIPQESIDMRQLPSSDGQVDDTSSSGIKGGSEQNNEIEESPAVELAQEYEENSSEVGGKPDVSSQYENARGDDNLVNDQSKLVQDGGMAQSDMKDHNTREQDDEKVVDSSTDQNKTSTTKTEEKASPQASSSETKLMGKEGDDNQKREEKSVQPVLDQPSSSPPTFSVSQALDALTEMDDTTQVAVNSVFNVIEDMITQLEVENDGEDEESRKHKVEQQKTDSGNLSSDSQIGPENDMRANRLSGKSISNRLEGTTGSHIGEENGMEEQTVAYQVSSENPNKYINNIVCQTPLYITRNPFQDPLYKKYLQNYRTTTIRNTKLDIDKTTALFLDYFPDEGQWKLLDQNGHNKDYGDVLIHESGTGKVQVESPSKAKSTENVIEPSYIILDDEKQHEPIENYVMTRNMKINATAENGADASQELIPFVRNIILDCLRVEVGRRLSVADIKETKDDLARDLEHVANAVSLSVGYGQDVFALNGEHIAQAISSATRDTHHLRKVLPLGVILGSCLAALKKFKVPAETGDGQDESLTLRASNSAENYRSKEGETNNGGRPSHNINHEYDRGEPEAENLNRGAAMVGAVTAAVGASAFLMRQQDLNEGTETSITSSKTFKEKEQYQGDPGKLEEASDKGIVTSLAEKAMSVAGPVVPTKEDGELDQERLVAMLAELGQKGGMLRLVGKVALLWGGIRGAMSLTDKLISFLRLAERPLFQRILGFVCMVLVLWSPVVIPLLPTLVQSWAMHSSSRISEFACIIGLYTSIIILVMLWGKRIRGYENSFEQYGLDLTTLPKIQNFLKGFIGGVMLVISIQFVNGLLGAVHLSWPFLHSTPSDIVTWIKLYGGMLILIGHSLVTATGVALVEELLFRSWLPDEIAADIGYHRGIIISGLAFSLSQRSPWAIPGLWLLSLFLSGTKQRSHGSLSLPIGLRSGMLFSSFVLQKGTFLSYQHNIPIWVTGGNPFQPFSGIVGLSISLFLGTFFYPRQGHTEKVSSIIKE